MAISVTLVSAGRNSLRYLLTQDGAAGTTATITATGAATPDLLTDSVAGPIKNLAKVITDGFATFAAGAQTQAKARALWLSDFSGADPAPGDPAGVNSPVATARCRITPITIAALWGVDADVSAGNPILSIIGGSAASSAYLDVELPGAIGA